MVKDEAPRGQGSDIEKWRELQELMGKLADWQEQAIQVPCPNCRTKLGRNDIASVFCPICGKVYNCQILVESCGLKLDD